MRLKASKAFIGLLGGGLALILGLAGFGFWAQSGALAQTMSTLRKKDDEVRNGERVAKQKEDAEIALEQDRTRIQFLENGVSDQAYVPTLLKQLEELGIRTHNEVRSIRPTIVVQAPTKLEQRRDPEAQAKGEAGAKKEAEKKPKKKEEPYTKLAVGVQTIGDFQSTQTFLQQITRFPKIIAVDEMTLHPHQGAGRARRENALQVELKLTAFLMKENAAGAKTPGGAAADGDKAAGAAAPAGAAGNAPATAAPAGNTPVNSPANPTAGAAPGTSGAAAGKPAAGTPPAVGKGK